MVNRIFGMPRRLSKCTQKLFLLMHFVGHTVPLMYMFSYLVFRRNSRSCAAKGLWRSVRERDCYYTLQSGLSLLDLYQFLITAFKVCEQVVENHSSWLLQHDGTRELHL